ncbi:MAG: ABC transporter ATP-binding protein [Acidimicrobiia bacterium]|nr:ABC transporter ATP-binding protein [Acidimicrobiia bacterium]
MVTGQSPHRPTSGPRLDDALIVCDNLVKIYQVADLEVVALQGLDLVVERAEFVALVGASGSGKSTLLNILGGLDKPSAGKARVGDFDLIAMTDADRTAYRRNTIGFVWQQTARNLLPYLSAVDNVAMPMLLAGSSSRQRRTAAMTLLEVVGLADRHAHKPGQLSGGEQQRVAVAIALANDPQVLFADEPTGELDTATSAALFDVLRSVNEQRGVTIVVVTHDPQVADHVRRTVAIRDGRTSSEVLRRTRVGADGAHQVVSEEFAVLDRAGRLQLPTEYVEALELDDRVRLTLDPDHINVWPDEDGANDR